MGYVVKRSRSRVLKASIERVSTDTNSQNNNWVSADMQHSVHMLTDINEWVASNRILVFAHRFLGSPRGKHCNSLPLDRHACQMILSWQVAHTLPTLGPQMFFSPCLNSCTRNDTKTCIVLGWKNFFLLQNFSGLLEVLLQISPRVKTSC